MSLKVFQTGIEGLLILEPQVFEDHRGFFVESWNSRTFYENTGVKVDFVEDNHSHSLQGVLRGLHYQLNKPQGKLVRVVSGKVLDVAVDLRRSSATFGKYFSIELSDKNFRQLWIPEGFAHGYLTLSSNADFLYKTSDYYFPKDEVCIKWDDPVLNIDWAYSGIVTLSNSDSKALAFEEAPIFK